MQSAIDATDIDRGPIVNNQIEVSLYFILFVVIFSFFFINIFVALIILTFQDEKEKEQGNCELERNQVFFTIHKLCFFSNPFTVLIWMFQRDCLHIAIIKKPIQRFMPDNPNSPRYRVWQIVDSAPFEYFIMLLIILNTLTMMMKVYDYFSFFFMRRASCLETLRYSFLLCIPVLQWICYISHVSGQI